MSAPAASPHQLGSCPFCESSAIGLRYPTQSEDGTSYCIRTCQACGTAFLSPPPTAAQLSAAYDTSYYGEGETKFNPLIERFRDVFARLRLNHLTHDLPAGATILDVGCGDGRLLRRFQQAGDFVLHGIELPGPAAHRAAQTPGLHLHLGTLNSVELPSHTFDLISLVHVLEHLPEPCAALDRLAHLIRPNGRLFLAFPNIESWQARWSGGAWFHLDPPRHLTLVPPCTVIEHLAKHGFRLLAQRHLCLEQNTYGWLQSLLNRLDPHRNFLYERLKRNRGYLPNRGCFAFALHAAIAAAVLPAAILLDCLSAIARAGATVELTFERSVKN